VIEKIEKKKKPEKRRMKNHRKAGTERVSFFVIIGALFILQQQQ